MSLRGNNMKDKETIAVWFSCGAASAVALQKTLEKYGDTHNVRAINNFVLEEDKDNRRFLKDVENWLGITIEVCQNPKYPNGSAVKVWEDRSFMSSPYGAPCTLELKKEARKYWEQNNKADHHVLGFTYEEKHRHDRFVISERKLLPVLIEDKITKPDCYRIINDAGIKLPRIYRMGYPNANCIGCVKATSPTYWNHVRKMHPEVFKERAEQSEKLGASLVKVRGERILLKDLDPNVQGRPLKNMDFECGIFCEELE